MTELWGILYGLEIAWAKDIRKLYLDLDLLSAIKLIMGQCSVYQPYFSIVQDIQEMMGWNGQV